MKNIKLVIDVILNLMDTRLTFAPYSFTIFQFLVAISVLGVLVYFISKIFSN